MKNENNVKKEIIQRSFDSFLSRNKTKMTFIFGQPTCAEWIVPQRGLAVIDEQLNVEKLGFMV